MAKAATVKVRKPTPGKLDDAAIEAFLRTHAATFLALPNVIGVSVAKKRRGGVETDELAVVFDVSAKLGDAAQIAAAGSSPLPASVEIGGVSLPTDIVQSWYVAQADTVRPGMSIGNAGGETGTLGAIVRQRGALVRVGLSNWHVLANPPGESSVLQPGLDDGGIPGEDAVGEVIDRQLGGIDAAIMSLKGRAIDPNILGLGVSVQRYRKPVVGDRVIKFGKATQRTCGQVKLAIKPIVHRFPGQLMETQIDSVVIEVHPGWAESQAPLSASGDSGSAWMLADDAGMPTGTMVALHWGIDAATGQALACSATDVQKRFSLVEDASDEANEVIAVDGGVLPEASAALPIGIVALGQPHRVTARDGLALRALADKDSPKIGGKPWNSLVHVLSRKDGWGMVDLHADGKSDGFMSLDFLRAGAEPLPDLSPTAALAPQGLAIDRVKATMAEQMFPPLATVRTAIGTNLPHVLAGLRAFGLTDRDMVLMALATIRAETEGFRPISEAVSAFNTNSAPFDAYERPRQKALDLGNVQAGDGARFKGRGFVQLTGRFNYATIGPLVGAALEANPELANDAAVAGRILAAFLKRAEARVRPALAEGSVAGLKRARRAVNGGSHGFDRFEDAWSKGRALLA